MLAVAPEQSIAVGVGSIEGDEPYSVSSMGSVDGRSWKYIRLYFVPLSFQLSLHLVEDQPSIPINKAENVFPHDPTRLNLSYCSKHFWPEVAFVLFPEPLSCEAVWLAWKPSSEDVNSSSPNSEICFCDVFISNSVWPIMMQDTLPELIPLAVELVTPAHPFGG